MPGEERTKGVVVRIEGLLGGEADDVSRRLTGRGHDADTLEVYVVVGDRALQ